MTAQIIDGAKKAEELKASLKKEVEKLVKEGVTPTLATILVGDDPSSRLYLKLKEKACVEVGIKSNQFELPADASEGEVISLIRKLNSDELVHGILVQLPLPKHLDEYKILSNINPSKDVDGFHPENIGRLAYGDESLAPATPKGILILLEDLTELEGKNVCIVNHSIVVGKPLTLMLLSRNATVDVCHVYTKNLANHTKAADILISATGVSKLIKKDMVAAGTIVIDVGINKTEEGITGDVDFEKVKEKASHITPVPGGVGPMTITILLQNTITAASQAHL